MDKKKQRDALFLIFSALVLAFAVYSWKKRQPPPMEPGFFIESQGLEVLAVLSDRDCTDCFEKVLCSWHEYVGMVEEIDAPVSQRLIIVSDEGGDFDVTQLENLCTLPGLSVYSAEKVRGLTGYPVMTPSIMVLYNGRVVSQHPIFVDTNLINVQIDVSTEIDNMAGQLITDGLAN